MSRAALIAALFTVLAVQEFRFEGYETEKAALLVIFGGVLLVTLRRVPWRDPVTIGVLLLFGVSALATLFSLSPAISLTGAADRGHGLLVLAVYALIYLHARQTPLWEALLPVLVMIAVPLCVFAILTVDIQPRPGAMTGNPNYLSSWLVLALPMIVTLTLIQVQKPVVRLLVGGVALLMLYTLTLTASRGALLALLVGALVALVAWAALGRRRRVLMGIAGVGVVAGIAYVIIGASVDTTSGAGRLFRPYDAFRIEAWTHAATVLNQQTDPLPAHDGTPDPYAGLRPVVGYGPDTVAQTQSRFGAIQSFGAESIFLNSFHNLTFDSLVMLGWPGLLAQVLIYGGAAYVVLRALGLYGRGWFVALAVGAVVGVIGALVVVRGAALAALLPLGIGMGAVLGVLAWLAIVDAPPRSLDNRTVLLVGLLAVVVVRWVDHQFGFPQVASEPLWWLLLGGLVMVARAAAEPANAATGWLWATLSAGLLLLFSLGSSIESDVLTHALGTDDLPVLLLVTLGVGMTFALLQDARPGWREMLLLVAVWGGFFIVKMLINRQAGAVLDAGLQSPEAVGVGVLILGAKGVMVVAVLLGVWWRSGGYADPPLRRLTLALVVAGLVLGSAYYATNHTGAVLHSVGNTLAEAGFPAESTYDAAADVMPYSAALHYNRWLNSGHGLEALFEIAPYYNNTLQGGGIR